MSVHPTVQKRGVGGLLLEALLAWLDGRGCSSVLLDATPVGAGLYARYGFVEDDKTLVLRQEALRLLKRYGFGEQRVLSHMRKGKHVQRSRHIMLYGQASLGFG